MRELELAVVEQARAVVETEAHVPNVYVLLIPTAPVVGYDHVRNARLARVALLLCLKHGHPRLVLPPGRLELLPGLAPVLRGHRRVVRVPLRVRHRGHPVLLSPHVTLRVELVLGLVGQGGAHADDALL